MSLWNYVLLLRWVADVDKWHEGCFSLSDRCDVFSPDCEVWNQQWNKYWKKCRVPNKTIFLPNYYKFLIIIWLISSILTFYLVIRSINDLLNSFKITTSLTLKVIMSEGSWLSSSHHYNRWCSSSEARVVRGGASVLT